MSTKAVQPSRKRGIGNLKFWWRWEWLHSWKFTRKQKVPYDGVCIAKLAVRLLFYKSGMTALFLCDFRPAGHAQETSLGRVRKKDGQLCALHPRIGLAVHLLWFSGRCVECQGGKGWSQFSRVVKTRTTGPSFSFIGHEVLPLRIVRDIFQRTKS